MQATCNNWREAWRTSLTFLCSAVKSTVPHASHDAIEMQSHALFGRWYGELRQPGSEVMRKLSGAKDKLSLRMHGLIIGSPEKKRADPAVLRGLCTSTLPNGKTELLVTEFSSWASVQADDQLGAIDYDDLEGNARRRLAGLKREADRQAEIRIACRWRGVLTAAAAKPDDPNNQQQQQRQQQLQFKLDVQFKDKCPRRRSGMRGSSKPKAGGTTPNEEFKMPTAREGRQKS
eukprot:1160151-Pelagomonas_calceolata.AAC.1